jgi:hypothetical protein
MLIPIKSFQVTTPALLFEPEFYVFDVSTDLETTKFLMCEEKLLELAPFIDIRFEPLAQGQFTVASNDLFKLEAMHDIKRPQSVYIFHHAFVCSTLLSRCLNQIDAFFSLKEPWILRRLSDFKRAQRHSLSDQKWQVMFSTYLKLLAKNYHKGKTPVIKVTNVANNLLEDVLQYLPGQKILYLYSDLESFLISNLKKPLETQQKMPGLAADFLSDGDFHQKYPQFCQLNNLNFLQVCALIWVVNLYNFKSNTESMQSENIKTLDMKQLLTDMRGNLEKLSQFFNHNPTAEDINAMLDPSITQTDAKHQQVTYGQDTKEQESARVLKKYAKEIEKVQRWINPIVDELKLVKYCQDNKL